MTPALAAVILGAWLAVSPVAGAALAQDFATPAPGGRGETPAAFLERALPASRARAAFELLAIAWDPAAQLTTRAVAGAASWHGLAWAAGISSSGDQEVGWNTAALALGQAGAAHGAGVRAAVRMDRARDGARARAPGGEAGAGFWSALGSRGRIWASAPMALVAGEAPPLDRGLETGVSLSAAEFSAWLAWAAPAGAVDAGERHLGLSCESGMLALWAEARDRPLRAALAVRARRGVLTVTAEVDEHPMLGESARVSLAIGAMPP